MSARRPAAALAPATLLAAVLLLGAACAHGPSAKERRGAEIHHDLGVEALRNGRAPEALGEFDQAIAADDRFAEAWLGRGIVLEYGFGRTDEAERSYRKAIELKPRYSEAQNNLGQLLARNGRYEQALAAFDAALDNMLYAEPYKARCNKGLALWRMGRRDEGLAELKTCLQVAPRYCEGHRELGRVLLQENRQKEALDELGQYARVCERAPDAHLQLGLARMKAGDVPGAREAFQRCEELGGSGAEAEECRRTRALLE